MVVPIDETSNYTDDTCPNIEVTVHENRTISHKQLYEWSEYTQVLYCLVDVFELENFYNESTVMF